MTFIRNKFRSRHFLRGNFIFACFGGADFEIIFYIYIRKQSEPAPTTDGVFLVRGDGFENIGYDPKRLSTFAEVPSKATITLVNINHSPAQVRLSYEIPGESQDSLIIQDQQGNAIARNPQQQNPSYSITIQPGTTNFTFVNTGSKTAIIQNPIEATIPSL